MFSKPNSQAAGDTLTLFLGGDIMTGRGVDQIFSRSCHPLLHEPYVKDARRYCELAEQAHGPVPRPVDHAYIWGDALEEWDRVRPDARIVNLETAITTSDQYWKNKGIHYRMHPANVGCLTAADIDCCALANNHILDWGYAGLSETLNTLHRAGMKTAGAGENREQAEAPAAITARARGRVLVFAFGLKTSGMRLSWAAGESRPGVNLIPNLFETTLERIRKTVNRFRREGDIVVASIHWGGNWGYAVPRAQQELAHWLIEYAQVDVIHGHSSHHVVGIETYRDRLILYGCGDLLTDYEGISGHEAYRGDLGLMYFARVEAKSGRLIALEMTPTQVHRMRLQRPSEADVLWLRDVLNREGQRFGTSVEMAENRKLHLRWERRGTT